MSKYRKSCGNGWSGDSQIIPLAEKDAQKWVEKHCDADTYINLFGEVEE